MQEAIYNLFYYTVFGIINEISVVTHYVDGTDKEKLDFLAANVERDFLVAKKYPIASRFKIKKDGLVSNAIDHKTYRDLCSQGADLLIFEDLFIELNASDSPLVILTPVKDGKIFIEGVDDLKGDPYKAPDFVHVEHQDDWLKKYIANDEFKFVELINDDYFTAIKMLFNSQQYVSAMKLLMICIDTLAYLEYDDASGNFKGWLNLYADLSKLNITADELWEFRNALLHMSTVDSRKVKANKVSRLMFIVAPLDSSFPNESDEGKYFNFWGLINLVSEAINNWAESYNKDRSKFEKFVERYDRIIADSRMNKTYFNNQLQQPTSSPT